MRTAPDFRDARGFTLIEVMIAMFFLSFIVGQMALITIYSSHSSAYAQRLTRANMIAEDVLERCRNTAFVSLNVAWTETIDGATSTETCGASSPATTPATTVCVSTGYGQYTRTRTVQYQTTGDPATSYTANAGVTVSWIDMRGATQRAQVATVISKF
jgi:prepilin-type N-terminal cleavage/methylation domain-containing protein